MIDFFILFRDPGSMSGMFPPIVTNLCLFHINFLSGETFRLVQTFLLLETISLSVQQEPPHHPLLI